MRVEQIADVLVGVLGAWLITLVWLAVAVSHARRLQRENHILRRDNERWQDRYRVAREGGR